MMRVSMKSKHISCSCHCTYCVGRLVRVFTGQKVANFFYVRVITVAAIPYTSTCEETIQCSPRMGQGADCSEGICVCKDGFHYLHGICHRSSGKCTKRCGIRFA